MEQSSKNKSSNLGLTFHRAFSLNRPAIKQVLDLANRESDDSGERSKLTPKEISENTSLGTVYVQSMPLWAIGSGLLNHRKLPTLFGKYAHLNDSLLEHIGTQWLMHYFLCNPHGAGPKFWHDISSKLFYSGNIFSSDDVFEHIGNFVWKNEDRVPKRRDIQSTTAVFLGTYTKTEGLNKLRLLETTSSGLFLVNEPKVAPVWAVAYALLDFWESHFQDRLSIGLDTLQESCLKGIFLIGKSSFLEMLDVLQENRVIDIHRTAPPHQVFLLRRDREMLLQNLYGIS